MPEKDPPIISFGKKGPAYVPNMVSEAPTIQGGDYKKGNTEYSDPFFSGGDTDFQSRQNIVEAGQDAAQSSIAKFGNGLGKFAGSFANGALGTVGTVYGILPAIFTADGSKLWDNPFTKAGEEINSIVQENTRNYQSLDEKNASAWSPSYWATLNFLSDNIMGNLGYVAESALMGGAISKGLRALAPFIAGRNLKAGLDIIAQGGKDVMELKNLPKAYGALKNWDKAQQAISVGLASAGEASGAAYSVYTEAKENMIRVEAERYGGRDNIPQSKMEEIEANSKSAGNTSYMLNLPIIAASDMMQWGKSLVGFNSEFKSFSKNALKVESTGLFEDYVTKAANNVKGIKGSLLRGGVKTVEALKSNLTEAAQEGAQYIADESSKTWYQRKTDLGAWDATWELLDNPIEMAVKNLFNTKEGVANLLGGFAGGIPFGMKNYIKSFTGDPRAEKLDAEQLAIINKVFPSGTLKENLRTYVQNMVRHTSAENDLQTALIDGDEHRARNAKHDQLKSYISSRIKTGRADLLEGEMDQLDKLSDADFKSFFGLTEEDDINKARTVMNFREKSTEMLNTYKMIDRVFSPDIYKLKGLDDDKRKEKLGQLEQHKDILWSYMMDYKDRDKRAGAINKELTGVFGSLLDMDELMKDKFKSEELNDLYRQYIAATVESSLNKQAMGDSSVAGPSKDAYAGQNAEQRKIDALRSQIKQKMEEKGKGNLLGQVLDIDTLTTASNKATLINNDLSKFFMGKLRIFCNVNNFISIPF